MFRSRCLENREPEDEAACLWCGDPLPADQEHAPYCSAVCGIAAGRENELDGLDWPEPEDLYPSEDRRRS